MNNGTRSEEKEALTPLGEILTGGWGHRVKANSQLQLNGFRYYLTGEAKILDSSGDIHKVSDLVNNGVTSIEALSLQNDKIIKSELSLQKNDNGINFDIAPSYLLTTSDGITLKTRGSQKILTSSNDLVTVAELDTGDIIKSGVLRYDHSYLHPSLNLNLNFVIEAKKVKRRSSMFYTLTSEKCSTILVGEERDGETSVICLAAG